jgi:hypothetical protein
LWVDLRKFIAGADYPSASYFKKRAIHITQKEMKKQKFYIKFKKIYWSGLGFGIIR